MRNWSAVENGLEKVEKVNGTRRSGYKLEIWCFSLLPDWAWSPGFFVSLRGNGRELFVGVLAGATCAQHAEFLHNGCGANDAPRDMNSLAPVRRDAWSSLPHTPSDQFQWKTENSVQVEGLLSGPVAYADFKSDHSGLECESRTAEKSAAARLFLAQPDRGETIQVWRLGGYPWCTSFLLQKNPFVH